MLAVVFLIKISKLRLPIYIIYKDALNTPPLPNRLQYQRESTRQGYAELSIPHQDDECPLAVDISEWLILAEAV